jgi:uncharacterized repeat protein (TIGR02543 family)
MKLFVHVVFLVVALGIAESAEAMPLGLRLCLWNRSARTSPVSTTFAVVFDPAGGEGTITPIVVQLNGDVCLPPCTLAKDGYVFAGWAKIRNGEKVWNDQQRLDGVESDITLYAIWLRPNCYGIAFDPGVENAEWSMDYQSVEIGKVAKLNPCAFAAPAGKRFAGWRRKDSGRRYDDGMLVFNLASEPGAVIALEAVWEDLPR